MRQKPTFDLPADVRPAQYYPRQPREEQAARYREARGLGERMLREGKVAAFIVAGGQGTRLGWDAPKGTFPATPVRKASLFQAFAEFIRKAQDKYGSVIPWYIMTSPANDAATRAFFEEHRYFGLQPRNVMLFPQAMMPAIDCPPPKIDAGIFCEPPMSIATAMVSPSARPRPSIVAPMVPVRALGSTTSRIISQRVEPSAYAPKISASGVLSMTSRVTDVMIGRIMIASTTLAAK